jgi:hypothetical protein
MAKKAWLEKFRYQVENQLDQITSSEEILAQVEEAEKQTKSGKARCIANAIVLLEDRASPQVLDVILQGCSCNFPQARLVAIREIYQASPDISVFVCRVNESGLFNEPIQLVGDRLVITKKPYRPDLRTIYPNNPIAWYCHCGSIVKVLHGNISPAICQCGAGFYQPLFSTLFGRPVQLEVRESLLQGNSQCIIAIQIPP